jgi:hypothetical protein
LTQSPRWMVAVTLALIRLAADLAFDINGENFS